MLLRSRQAEFAAPTYAAGESHADELADKDVGRGVLTEGDDAGDAFVTADVGKFDGGDGVAVGSGGGAFLGVEVCVVGARCQIQSVRLWLRKEQRNKKQTTLTNPRIQHLRQDLLLPWLWHRVVVYKLHWSAELAHESYGLGFWDRHCVGGGVRRLLGLGGLEAFFRQGEEFSFGWSQTAWFVGERVFWQGQICFSGWSHGGNRERGREEKKGGVNEAAEVYQEGGVDMERVNNGEKVRWKGKSINHMGIHSFHPIV